MARALLRTVLWAAWCVLAATGQAQTIYRCGSHYSQLPCEGAVEVQANDPRSAKQKSDSQKAIARDARTASAMEKTRRQEEKAHASAQGLLRQPDLQKPGAKESPAGQAKKAKTTAGAAVPPPGSVPFVAKVAPKAP